MDECIAKYSKTIYMNEKCHQGMWDRGSVQVLTSKEGVCGCYRVFSLDVARIYQAVWIVLQGILEKRRVGASIAICLGVIEQAFKGLAAICVLHVVPEGRGTGVVAEVGHEVAVAGHGVLGGAHQGEGAGAGHAVHSACGHGLLITLLRQRNLQRKQPVLKHLWTAGKSNLRLLKVSNNC